MSTAWPPILGALYRGTEGLYSDAGNAPLNPLSCFIGHGNPEEDIFWELTGTAAGYSAYITRTNMRITLTPDGAEQAAAIRACTADGARSISATLANVDAVGDALREAAAAGVQITTYNSGINAARSVGSALHLALDETAGGIAAGNELNKLGVSGDVWCVIHEEVNIGLEERCDGLESAYTGGTVSRMRIHDAAGREAAEAGFADESLAAVIALNVDTGVWAVRQTAANQRNDLVVATFGGSPELIGGIFQGVVRFVIWDQPTLQGLFMSHAAQLHWILTTGLPALEVGGAAIRIEPVVFDQARLATLLAGQSPGNLARLLGTAGMSAEDLQAFQQMLEGN